MIMVPNTENLIIGSIGILCTTLIIIAIALDIHNKRKWRLSKDRTTSNTEQNSGDIILFTLTYITLMIFLLHSASISLIRFDIHPKRDTFCKWLTAAHTILYHASRLFIYATLICRVHVTFKGSVYEYHRCIIYALYLFITINFIYLTISDIVFTQGYYDVDINACVPHFPLWGLIISFAVDSTLCIVSLILFIKPLIKLNKLSQIEDSIQLDDNPSSGDQRTTNRANSVHSSNGRRDNSLGALIIRYALLVIIAIGSTLLLYTAIALWTGISDVATPIDNVINVWCIILINKANKKIYKRLCYSCHGAMKKCCK